MELVLDIVLGIIGSSAIVTLIIFLITRHDNRKKFDEKLTMLEKDGLRTQLLIMITLLPQDKQEILVCAEKYFGKLHGDWFMTPIFYKWCQTYDVAEPSWFNMNEVHE